MTPTERRLHRLVNLLVAATGLVYLYMAWLLSPPDDWAVINHPWQPTVQHLHVLVAPLLVFAVGVLFRAHIVKRLRRRLTLDTGGLMILLFVPMVVSGYALQVSSEQAWRDGWAWVHVVSSGLWFAGYIGHMWGRRARAAVLRGGYPIAAAPSDPVP